ncbi:MAG: Gfo/Idh/MocA family oxidoreductase [Verrucomicrobiae bacterium]|nr:Gfo/Idh/MocA family oxidoreductase [Verrucomicrobiae bacterium]
MKSSRRRFLAGVTGTTAVGSLAGLDISRFAHAAGSGDIRLGLIGCGGRGVGAVTNALRTGPDVKLVALADAIPEQADWVLNILNTAAAKKIDLQQVKVSKERKFDGFDAYEKLLNSGVDAVILATPAGFRPLHFEAATKAGVHCFMESPVAVDAPGIRQIRAAAEIAKQKRLSAVVGLQSRFDKRCQQFIAEITKGAIGKLKRLESACRVTSFGETKERATLEKVLGRNLGELEYQIRNWRSFVWLSGDYFLDRGMHQLDICLWAAGRLPQSARGTAQRREKRGQDFGNALDSVSVSYRYDDDLELAADISSYATADQRWDCAFEGTKGSATSWKGPILNAQGQSIWAFQGANNSSLQEEMNQWCDSIRKGSAMSTVENAADSNLVAIMGRTAAYTGREVTWAEMLKSTETFFVRNPKSFQNDPPAMPDKFGDYVVPARGVKL